MAESAPILTTGAAGQVGGVGRTVTGLHLERGLPVRAMVHRGRTQMTDRVPVAAAHRGSVRNGSQA